MMHFVICCFCDVLSAVLFYHALSNMLFLRCTECSAVSSMHCVMCCFGDALSDLLLMVCTVRCAVSAMHCAMCCFFNALCDMLFLRYTV